MEIKETNIDLGLSMNTGIDDKTRENISVEEKQIAIKSGRDIDNQEKNDSVAAAVANFRLLSK